MKIRHDPKLNTQKLRQSAERQLAETEPEESCKPQNRLVHELQVHQIELEMQNEALREAHTHIEESLERYSELFDFAPVAYFTLDMDGGIHQTNFNGERLLGIERSKIVGRFI